jgi:hypothetical protein
MRTGFSVKDPADCHSQMPALAGGPAGADPDLDVLAEGIQ